MKAIFKNIGPINKAEIELKDLTIITGANNTGKTYIAYTLYGFLKLIQPPYLHTNIIKKLPFDLDEAVKKITDSGSAEFPIENFNDKIKKTIENICRISDDIISNIFSSPPEDFKNAAFSFDSEYSFEKESKNTIGFNVGRKEEYKISASFKQNLLSFNLQNYKVSPPPEIIKAMIINSFIGLYVSDFPNPFILSAERFGISLFYKELDFTKNRLVETLQKLKDKEGKKNIDPFFLFMDKTSARYAQPIKDNIDYTRDLDLISKKKSPLFDQKLFEQVKNILGGYFKYKNGEIRFVSTARKNGKFNISLYQASSSARGLSDLYFFLKHSAKKNQLLIIDEPESHLDTANQIKMARLLASCVNNNGIKVLITTHSDYIIKEFNNLIMLSQDFEGKEEILKEYSGEYGKNDYLKKESVAAYIAENNSLTACEVDNLGLNMPNFDRTIDKINKIANKLALSVEK
ncbi:MAG: ATP-binding protein [Deltaproteobacteria bacterium]|nr:ATP-binding protein [Deltaproteobacteria bacterium]